MSLSDAVELVTLMVAVVGVGGGLIALRQGNRQQLLELGNLYIQRYWSIEDELLCLPRDSGQHRLAQQRYLRLCEDEFEAARLGWLDPQQWTIWHQWLTTSRSTGLLTEYLAAGDASPEGYLNVRTCLKGRVDHDWKDCPANRPEVGRTQAHGGDQVFGSRVS